MRSPYFAAFLTCLALVCLSARAEVRVANLHDGEVLRYPVVLLSGQGAEGSAVIVRNADNPRPDGLWRGPATEGRFKALVELVPGRNTLNVFAGASRQTLTVTYRPATTDRKVNFIYLTADDDNPRYLTQRPNAPQDYRAQMDTLAKMMQAFAADDMNRQGYGRKTFHTDFDANGKVRLHTLRLPMSRADLHKKTGNELYDIIHAFIAPRFPMDRNKNVVVMAFTGYDAATKTPLAHTALGGGGLALFSSNGMYTWPDSLADVPRAFTDTTPVDDGLVWDDSSGRSHFWGLASTTTGAVIHEMGHTMGLPHPEPGLYIMARGFDQWHRAFIAEEVPSRRNANPLPVTPEITPGWHPDHAARLALHPWFQPDPFQPTGYIRGWRLSPEPVSWPEAPNPPALSASDRQRIVSVLRKRPVTTQDYRPSDRGYSFDVLRHYGGGENTLAYALATVNAREDTPKILRAGGDDGIRVWLNGTLVINKPGVEAVEADPFTAPVTLVRGENTILVEIAQGAGDWGFSVRLADPPANPPSLI